MPSKDRYKKWFDSLSEEKKEELREKRRVWGNTLVTLEDGEVVTKNVAANRKSNAKKGILPKRTRTPRKAMTPEEKRAYNHARYMAKRDEYLARASKKKKNTSLLAIVQADIDNQNLDNNLCEATCK